MSPASISTRFTKSYNLDHPIACAGLAFVGALPDFHVAVSKTGALGAFGVGPFPPEVVAQTISAIKSQTDQPVHVNFITIFTSEAHIDACIEQGADIVSFHWGHPRKDWIKRLHAAGISVWEQVGSAGATRQALDNGIDLIIAQGTEAGGHNYAELPTFVNVPDIVDAAQGGMVLASGGVMDGRGLAAALALGADGVWVGTRFAASTEANVPAEYRKTVFKASGHDTTRSHTYGPETPDFNPMRLYRNPLVAACEEQEDLVPQTSESQPVIGETRLGDMALPLRKHSALLAMADSTGDFDFMPMLMGQGVGQLKSEESVDLIVNSMVKEARDVLKNLSNALV